jgi:hypothetical protein
VPAGVELEQHVGDRLQGGGEALLGLAGGGVGLAQLGQRGVEGLCLVGDLPPQRHAEGGQQQRGSAAASRPQPM